MVVDYSLRLVKTDWEVKSIDLKTARALIQKYHYAKSATKTRVYVHGLFKKNEEECFGVAWWLPPTKNAAIATYPEGDFRKVLSLTRLVISPGIPKNACSFLLSKSMKLIDSDRWECLVTYADTWQEHRGIIYKATNWEYMGLTKPTPVWINSEGIMMGKKRGARNLTNEEMCELGFYLKGRFSKHKFRYLLK